MLRILISALAAVLIHGAVLVFFPFFSAPRPPVFQEDTGIAIQISHVLPEPEKPPAPEPEKPPAPEPEKPPVPEPEKNQAPAPPPDEPPPPPDTRKEPPPAEITARKDLMPKKQDVSLAPRKPEVPAPEPEVTAQLNPDPEADESPSDTAVRKVQAPPRQVIPRTMDPIQPAPGRSAPTVEKTNTPPVRKEAIPLYRDNPPPRYPGNARRRGHSGTVLLMVYVNENGEADQVRIFESSGHASLDRAAEIAVAEWRFEPGTSGGIPTGMWVKIPITFELKK
jgi:protein TonB